MEIFRAIEGVLRDILGPRKNSKIHDLMIKDAGCENNVRTFILMIKVIDNEIPEACKDKRS